MYEGDQHRICGEIILSKTMLSDHGLAAYETVLEGFVGKPGPMSNDAGSSDSSNSAPTISPPLTDVPPPLVAVPPPVPLDSAALIGRGALYYATAERAKNGPVSVEQLEKLHGKGVIHDSSQVWEEGMAGMLTYKKFMERHLVKK